ncbi:putative clathrin assembly protein At2g01600 [Andrographis paniculata]|uniref:putative clathrin assembly protein At2g01600 n=1 Tax=Andrographis paniculata TaxID=175694 RepID=UPI0021E87E2B|nr:putative clathrin assembly protein At2g01600 [Andrographis paniculata]
MAALHSWRKAYGALKDHTKVGLAHVNSGYKDLDVAIVKATNHVECPPKDRHLKKIMIATAAARPRADVAYCINALSKRLLKTHNWTVALKTLIVFHRLLREGDSKFRDTLLGFQQRGRVLHVSSFKDDSSPVAWDCSAWVRTYALFLEQRLECFSILKYDIEAERLRGHGQGQDKRHLRSRDLDNEELLEQLPALQQLLHRLIGCRPEGAAACNSLVQYALALVLKESFKIYMTINASIINLVDKFFDMPRLEAIQALDIYKRATQQATNLTDFYDACKGAELARNFQFPVLREPPQSFIITMEDHIREAPREVSVPTIHLEYPERLMLTYKQEDNVPSSSEESPKAESPPRQVDVDDLLGLNSVEEITTSIDDTNASAFAIVPCGDHSPFTENCGATAAIDINPVGWELALVSTTDLSSSQEKQLAGGLDSLKLNSLYDEGASQEALSGSHFPSATNPFSIDSTPNSDRNTLPVAPQPCSSNPFYSFRQDWVMNPQNPFLLETGFHAFPAAAAEEAQTSNPFGSSRM